MATWDVFIEGTNLNTLANQVDFIENRRQSPFRTDLGSVLSSAHGESTEVGNYSATVFGLEMWVDAVDPITGIVPTNWEQQLEANTNRVIRMMQKPRGQLLQVDILQPSGAYYRAFCKVIAFTQTQVNLRTVRLNFGLKNPSVFWEGLISTTLTFTNFTGVMQNITNLTNGNSTAPITDAILKVKGPTTGTMSFLTGPVTGLRSNLYMTRALAATETWIVDCGKQLSSYGVGITNATQGTPCIAQTNYFGSEGRPFDIYPDFGVSGDYGVSFQSSGTTSASTWSITTKPKFL